MKMKKYFLKLVLLFFIGGMISNLASAEIKLPAIFCNNMVMQQQTNAMVWGKANPNAVVKVTTSWNKKSYNTKSSENGSWKLKVSTPIAGGPYEMAISDGTPVTLKNVLIGEVWVCSGQSNMEMPLKGFMNQPILGSLETINNSSNPNIRMFTVTKKTSILPLDSLGGKWDLCEPEFVGDFSATAYYFGLMLNKTLNVPIGLINTSWGGTRIEPWISDAGFKNFDWVKMPEKKPVVNLSPQTPTVLFNGMINPIVGYGIRGAIWYQGESNRNEAKAYQKLMPGLIENWRSVWDNGDFPFYFVQIAPYDYGLTGLSSAYLREAQLKASTAIKNTEMACIMDIGEKNNIHPANKKAGGDRLAYLALANTYNIKGIVSQGPVMKEMTINGSNVKLSFDFAPLGLTSFGKEVTSFEVAGSNKKFYPAKAIINKNEILLSSPQVDQPIAVRYAFKDFIVGELFNTYGLPATSFRTDDWDPEKQ